MQLLLCYFIYLLWVIVLVGLFSFNIQFIYLFRTIINCNIVIRNKGLGAIVTWIKLVLFGSFCIRRYHERGFKSRVGRDRKV